MRIVIDHKYIEEGEHKTIPFEVKLPVEMTFLELKKYVDELGSIFDNANPSNMYNRITIKN